MSEKEGFKLGGIATLALLASLAADGKEAKAEPGVPGGQEIHDLLLCTYANYDDQLFGSMVNDPKSANDKIYPGNFDDLDKYPDYGPPRTWKGYIFRETAEYYTGNSTYRVYRIINGKEVEVGQLDYFNPSDLVRFISDSGIVLASGKFYGLTDTGTSVVDEELGDSPVSGSSESETYYGGYIWVKHVHPTVQYKDLLTIMSEEDISNSTPGGEVPVASQVELPLDNNDNPSLGMSIDSQTGEVVVAIEYGFRSALLPQLDANGKLPSDFSLTGLTFSSYEPLGYPIKGVVADSGYRYFLTGMSDNIIVVTPDGTKYTIAKNQLGAGGTIYEMLKLDGGGIYVLFNGKFNQPPVSLVPTTNPSEFMAPGLPFKIIIDEPTGYTKYIPDDGCAKYQGSTDPCEGIVCESANQCKDAVCDQATGDCVEQNKPDDSPCDDNNVCTPNDHCVSGQCESVTVCPITECKIPITCDPVTEPEPCPTENKPDGTPCDDYDPDTKESQCEDGECKEKPIVNPEPDTVEPNPETGSDVVEQEPDTVEPSPELDTDVVEQAPDTVEPDPDVVEQDSQGETGDSEATSPDTNTSDSSDVLEVANPDVKEDLSSETSADIVGEDGKEVIGADTDSQEKAPGCGCDTHGKSPDSTNGALLLLGLGGVVTAITRLRRKLSAVLTVTR